MTKSSLRKQYIPIHDKDEIYCSKCKRITTHKRIAVCFETIRGKEFVSKWGYCLTCFTENDSSKPVVIKSETRRKTAAVPVRFAALS